MYSSVYSEDRSDAPVASLDMLLKHTICSFVRSQIVFVAVRLNLFSMIDESPTHSLSYEELKNSNISATMLSYLVYLRLLRRCPNSNRYECAPVARAYLIPSRENYVGLGIGVWDYRRQYTFFLRLNETLKQGVRTSEGNNDQSSLWSVFEQDHGPMIYFARIMSSFTRCTISELCDRVNFSPYSMLLDVGGSLGDLSRTIVTRYPHMKAFSLDLPEVTNFALSTNKTCHVQYIAGNFFDLTWPTEIIENMKHIDLVSLKYILHDWSHDKRQFLVTKAYELLRNKVQISGGNGTLLVIEKMIDENRQRTTTLCTSVSMAIECGDGIGYDATKSEYKKLLLQAGFQRIESVPLTGPLVALFAHLV